MYLQSHLSPTPPPKKKSVPYNVLDEEAIPFSFLANDKTTLLINVILR